MMVVGNCLHVQNVVKWLGMICLCHTHSTLPLINFSLPLVSDCSTKLYILQHLNFTLHVRMCMYYVVPAVCPVRHTRAQCLTLYFVCCLCVVRDRGQWASGSGGTASTATLDVGDC